MKTLEFRVYDKYENKWLDNNEVAITANGTILKYKQYPEDETEKDKEWDINHLSDQCIVQSFTGIRDKDGNKIYEGDVVEWRDWDNGWGHEDDEIEKGKGEVKWGTHSYNGYTWGFTIENFSNLHSIGLSVKEIKVIDNIIDKKLKK